MGQEAGLQVLSVTVSLGNLLLPSESPLFLCVQLSSRTKMQYGSRCYR